MSDKKACLLTAGLTDREVQAEYDKWQIAEEFKDEGPINFENIGVEALNEMLAARHLDVENTIRQKEIIDKLWRSVNSYYGNKSDAVLALLTHDPMGWGNHQALEGMTLREQAKVMRIMNGAFEEMAQAKGIVNFVFNKSDMENQQSMIEALFAISDREKAIAAGEIPGNFDNFSSSE